MNNRISLVFKALFYLFLVSPVPCAKAGIIEDTTSCTLPWFGKTVYMFGEEHTDPFEDDAVAQREDLAQIMESIMKDHPGALSLYLECDEGLQENLRHTSYCYLRQVCSQGAFFEQWYVPFARAHRQEVRSGQLHLSSFDIRDAEYAYFHEYVMMLADDEIGEIAVDFHEIIAWINTVVDPTLTELVADIQKVYPKKMISFIKRDVERKKKKLQGIIDSYGHGKKNTPSRLIKDFYEYTDLLVDFTILKKIATDPRDTVIIHAGAAHTQNLTQYLSKNTAVGLF